LNSLEDKQLVVKSNYLIEASYKMTTQEQRLILMMASMIKPEDKSFQTYEIRVKDFNDIVGIRGEGSYSKTKELTKKLLERSLIIQSAESLLQISWLSSAEYFDKKGRVELSFDPKLKPYLLELKQFFTRYQLQNVIRFKSIYSIRLYELLKQYEKIGERTFDLIEFKRILGIRPGSYKLYGHLKSKILNPVQKELKKNADIRFDFKEKKQGRKVVGIIFRIKQNTPKRGKTAAKEIEGAQIINPELYDRLQSYFCLSAGQAQEILNKYDEERISQNLAYVEDKKKRGLIENIGPYTLKAIHEDYRQQMSLFEVEEKEKKAQDQKKEAEKRLLERLDEDFSKYRREEVETFKKSLSQAKLKALEGGVKEKLAAKYGNRSLGLKKLIEIELTKNLAKMAGLPSREEWIENEKKKG